MAIDFKAVKSRATPIAVCGLCLLLTLSGCGRQGGLDAPGAAAPVADPAAVAAPAEGAGVAPDQPAPKSGFILDALI